MTHSHNPCVTAEFKTPRTPCVEVNARREHTRGTGWSPVLAASSLPPADTQRQNVQGEWVDIHYQFLPTLDEFNIPQMGLFPEVCRQTWLHDSDTLTVVGLAHVMRVREPEITRLTEDAVTRITEHTQAMAVNGVQNALRDVLIEEKFLRLKGNFAACPFCLLRDNWVIPIRQFPVGVHE
jgi:hypothetical protein